VPVLLQNWIKFIVRGFAHLSKTKILLILKAFRLRKGLLNLKQSRLMGIGNILISSRLSMTKNFFWPPKRAETNFKLNPMLKKIKEKYSTSLLRWNTLQCSIWKSCSKTFKKKISWLKRLMSRKEQNILKNQRNTTKKIWKNKLKMLS